jgi:hypothetical protein
MEHRRRYRSNAAECLSVASTCHSDRRSLLLGIADSWIAPARQEQATRHLLVKWSMAAPAYEAGPNAELSRQLT